MRNLIFLLIFTAALPVAALECTAKSGDRPAAVLELYTSEGCNSCPPADAWVNALRNKGFGAERIVPLAFHVDYWDYIGWKDRFAQSQFTQRQRQISQHNALGTIYTPQLVLNGVTMRRWGDNDKLNSALNLISDAAARATLTATSRVDGGNIHLDAVATLNDASNRATAQAFVAVFENNLVSDVRAGENSGVKLRHDHVVREWIGPLTFSAATLRIDRRIALAQEWKRPDLGIAIVVEDRESGAVLQALATPVCS